MSNVAMRDGGNRADTVRGALIEAALVAHEDAGLNGLCAEGRWEAAVAAMRSLDVAATAPLGTEEPPGASPGELPQSGKPAADLITSLAGVVAAIAGTSLPRPGGGSVVAAAGALAAALTQMVAGLTTGRPKSAHVAAEMQAAAGRAAILGADLSALVRHDATAVDAVTGAYRLPRRTEEEASTRARRSSRRRVTPRKFRWRLRAAAAVAELAASVAERGNTNAVADAAVAALLAECVCRAAAVTVRVNATALHDTPDRLWLIKQALALSEVAANAKARAVGAVDRA